MAGGALPVMVPALVGDTARGDISAAHYAEWLDGLLLHGGVDMSPTSYGEEPLDPRWAGDRTRDVYEMDLVRAFVAAGKPVFGICRGLQLINVTYGGTLYQDISTQRPEALEHRNGEAYDRHFHEVDLVPGTRLDRLLSQTPSRKINSIHHQGIKDLAPGFVAEALCPHDGTIEAIRHAGDAWVAAVQWHPEFHKPEYGVMDDSVLLHDFLQAARSARG
jgi:putative glutamine amidotransferase